MRSGEYRRDVDGLRAQAGRTECHSVLQKCAHILRSKTLKVREGARRDI